MSDISVEAEPRARQVSAETVEVKTLDSLANELIEPDDRICLKVDVQEFEREVLMGAKRTLEQVAFVEVELSIAPVYEGQPLIGDMLDVARRAGFELAILGNPWWSAKTGQVLQMDGVFCPRD